MPSNTDNHNPKMNPSDQTPADPLTNNGNQQQSNCQAYPNLGRQSSIYSLTLDEFQHTLCENGKNFGSMNMDEFLSSIWTAEENQSHHHGHDANNSTTPMPSVPSSSGGMILAKQPSLTRQGSLTLPAPLCRKTVDQVWTEIQRTHQQEDPPTQQHPNANSNSTQRQSTFGEMTLEDFLVKAGVVREHCGTGPGSVVPPTHSHHQYLGPSFVPQPMMGGYQAGGGDPSGKRNNNGYPTPSVACYGGRVTNGAPAAGFGAAGLSPVSPVSPDGICGTGQVDNSAAQYGLHMSALRGRKRIIDGPVEKVVERRQRRMIKNRESAARSRARKQAYTVELEAELNQLREENTQLKQALAEMERQRKQQYREEQRRGGGNSNSSSSSSSSSRAERALLKLKAVRRIQSCRL